MAVLIAGVFWQVLRLIRECRGGSESREGMLIGRYFEIFGLGDLLG